MALRDLNLVYCVDMTGVHLTNLTSLTRLDLSHCEGIIDEDMCRLKSWWI